MRYIDATAYYTVTGDEYLLTMKRHKDIVIINPRNFEAPSLRTDEARKQALVTNSNDCYVPRLLCKISLDKKK